MFYLKKFNYYLVLLIILQGSLAFSQPQFNIEEVSKAFVEAFSKSDFNAIKEMLLDETDSLGRYDCNCAEHVGNTILSNKNLAMKGVFTIHRDLLELKLDIEKIEYKKAFFKEKYEIFELYILAMYEQKYLLFVIEALPTSNGIKFVRNIKLNNNSDLIEKYFKVNAPEVIDLNKKQSLFLYPKRKLNCKIKKEEKPTESYSQIDYYQKDTLVATIYAYPKEKTVKVNIYYRNGKVNYSSTYVPDSQKEMNKFTKKYSDWNDVYQLTKTVKLVKHIDYFENGNIDNEKIIFEDSIRETRYFYCGQEAETIVRDKEKNVLRKVDYHVDGTLESKMEMQSSDKAKSIKDLQLFPSYEDMSHEFYSPYYTVRPPVVFHRQPQGWVVQCIDKNTDGQYFDTTQYLFWSYKKQNYLRLPENTFNKGTKKVKLSYKYIPNNSLNKSLTTGFSGYPDAEQDYIQLVEGDSNATMTDIFKLYSSDLNLFVSLLKSDDFVPNDEFKKKLVNYKKLIDRISQKEKSDFCFQISKLHYYIQLRLGKETAENYFPLVEPTENAALYLQMIHEEIEENTVFMNPDISAFYCYAKIKGLSNNIVFIDTECLNHDWYKKYLEETYQADIFKLDSKFYNKRGSQWHVKGDKETVTLSEYLRQTNNVNNNGTKYIKNIKFTKNSSRKFSVLDCHLSMSAEELEAIDFFLNKKGKQSLSSFIPYQSFENIETGLFLHKYCLTDNCKKTPLKNKLHTLIDYKGKGGLDNQLKKFFFNSIASYVLKHNEELNLIIYSKLEELYQKEFNLEFYPLAVDLVLLGFQLNYDDIAKQLLDKCFIYKYDYCLSFYIEKRSNQDAYEKLEEYLKLNKKELYKKYYMH